MRFDDPRVEWRISDLERRIDRKAESHEIGEMQRYVDRLEHSLRELSSVVDGLRNELQACQNQLVGLTWRA